jgi:hypothetical protein
MPWKRQVLVDFDQASIADAATSQTVKLPQTIIGAIYIKLSGTGGSGTIAVNNLMTPIKVKTDKGYICDIQSADLKSLARALAGTIPTTGNNTGALSWTNQALYFGRWPRDRAYMLDLRNAVVRQIEITFGTLVAATAFATGTVVLTVEIDEWVGAPPSEWKGCIGWKQVVDQATGTGRFNQDLFQGYRCPGILVYIGTTTTVRQCTLSDKKQSIIWGVEEFLDMLDFHNSEFNPDTAETHYALMYFWDFRENADTTYPDLSMVSDPAFTIERGTTTTTVRLVQGMIF